MNFTLSKGQQMTVQEQTQVADEALPVARFRAHLRLGTGFSDDAVQDGLLAGFLRAAIVAIEGRTGKALIARTFLALIEQWDTSSSHELSPTPLASVASITIEDAQGGEVAYVGWTHRSGSSKVVAQQGQLPQIPRGGQARISFIAGYGPSFDDVPADLAQAVMLLAAHYYEYRDETALSSGCMPFGVTALIDRYRPIRLTLGRTQ